MDMMLNKFQESMEFLGEICLDGGRMAAKEKKEEGDQQIFKWKEFCMKRLKSRR